MKIFHTLKFLNLVFMFLLCSQVYSVSPESTKFKESKKIIKVIFDLSPGKVRYEYKNNKRIEKPVFEYNPRADIIKSLKGAGFRLTRESNQKYDLALVIVYDEKLVLSSAGIPIDSTASFNFTLKDKHGMNILKLSHGQRNFPAEAKNYITKKLSGMIKGRLQAADEVSFLISQLKQGRSLGRPIKRNLVKSNMPLLKRLRELNDARTTEVFVSFLRSYNPNQRSIARSALGKLDYTPPKGTKDEVAFEMVSVINGRRKLHNIIITYGSPAIEMIIEDAKCRYTRYGGGRWYGGTDYFHPDRVLKSLTEEKMSPFLQKLNDTAVAKLIEVISTEHEELYGDAQSKFYDFAIDVLGEIADKRAIEPLKRYLAAHPESTTAKEAIGKIGDPQAVEQLITALNDKEKDVREKAALLLGKIGDPRAVEPLITALNDKDSSVRMHAARALEKIDDPQAVEQLITALNDKEKDAREKVASVLGEIGDPRAVEPLITALNDKDRSVRIQAARALEKIGDPRAVEPLIAALNDEDRSVRMCAAGALGELGDPRAVERLITALNEKDISVRKIAAQALGKIGDPRAVEPLIATLKDYSNSYLVRECVAEVLGKIGDPRAVEPLFAALRGSSSRFRKKGEEALERIKDRQGAEPFIPFLQNKNPEVRGYALKALDKMGWSPENDNQKVIYLIAKGQWDECVKIGKTAVEPMIAALKIGNKKLREETVEALGRIGDPRAVEPLIATLKYDRRLLVRECAAEALGKIDDPRVVEPLITALNAKERSVRIQAVQALGKIGDPRAVEPLITTFKYNRSYPFRECAVKALGKITGKDFGVNHKEWKRWWKRNKKKFLKK